MIAACRCAISAAAQRHLGQRAARGARALRARRPLPHRHDAVGAALLRTAREGPLWPDARLGALLGRSRQCASCSCSSRAANHRRVGADSRRDGQPAKNWSRARCTPRRSARTAPSWWSTARRCREPARGRALRSHPRRVHTGAVAARKVRSKRPRRHGVPRRDRRSAARDAAKLLRVGVEDRAPGRRVTNRDR